MQNSKKNLCQPFPVIQVPLNAVKMQKEIQKFFSEVTLNEVQDDIFHTSLALLNKEAVEDYGTLYLKNKQYGLQRILMLMTKLYMLTPKADLQ